MENKREERFIRCGWRYAINPLLIAFTEELDPPGGESRMKVGLSVGHVLELSREEAVPLRKHINSVSPLPQEPRTATPARSAPIKSSAVKKRNN